MALSLAAECAVGQTREQLLSALGLSYEQLKADIPSLYRSLNVEYTTSENQLQGMVQLGNSVWVNKGTVTKQACLDELSNSFFCDSYSADFLGGNQSANEAVRSFVKQKTKGLIDQDFELSTETVFALINTLYLKDIWNNFGEDLTFTNDTYNFVNSDQSTTQTQLLNGYYRAGRVHVAEKYSTFYTSTLHGYKLKFILPADGYSVEDVFTAENINEINAIDDYNAHEQLSEYEYREYVTRCLFPQFSASFNDDIKGVLSDAFGINYLFDEERCDLTNLCDVPSNYNNIYCEKVTHVTKLEVNKKGIEGAAVTVEEIAGSDSSGPIKVVCDDFVVDKAFGFILTDNHDVTLFSGVVNKI
jgi:serine protease inhibitor